MCTIEGMPSRTSVIGLLVVRLPELRVRRRAVDVLQVARPDRVPAQVVAQPALEVDHNAGPRVISASRDGSYYMTGWALFGCGIGFLGDCTATGPLLAQFPSAALGALVIFAAVTLIDVKEIRRIAKFRRSELLLAAPPWKMSGTPARWKSGCRLPGSDNRDVYLGILGMTEEEYRRLAEAGTI